MTDEVKDHVLRTVYYNDETGFQSVARTYQAAKKRLGDITLAYVKSWFERQKTQQLKPLKGFNSYIVDKPLVEVAVDLADYSRNAKFNGGYAYIFIAVDAFTKYCVAVPTKTKTGPDCCRALKAVIEKMGKFQTLFSDREGGLESKEVIRTLNANGIYHVMSSAPSGMAERMVKTIKDMLHARIQGLDLEKERWIDLLPKVVNQYNGQEHRTIGMSPNEALKPENRMRVWLSIKKHSVFTRTYEPLKIGDSVRTFVKRTTFSKGTAPRYSETVHKIVNIGKNPNGDVEYLLDNYSKRKVYQRYELRKVGGVEGSTTI